MLFQHSLPPLLLLLLLFLLLSLLLLDSWAAWAANSLQTCLCRSQ
jgi:hypothetical protein